MNLLKGGMRTFHDFDTEQQQGMACSVEALATDDATVILLCWPRRIRPLIRGVSRKKSRRPLQVGRSPMWNRLSSSCRDPWNGSCGRALVPPAPCMNLTRRLTTACSGWSAARSPLNRSVNAAELRTALWRCDLGAELPHLVETYRLICVHSYIVSDQT